MNHPVDAHLPESPPAATIARSAQDVAAARRMLALLKVGGDARGEKVRRLRRSVRAHAYENDLKLSVAVDRVVRDLGQ